MQSVFQLYLWQLQSTVITQLRCPGSPPAAHLVFLTKELSQSINIWRLQKHCRPVFTHLSDNWSQLCVLSLLLWLTPYPSATLRVETAPDLQMCMGPGNSLFRHFPILAMYYVVSRLHNYEGQLCRKNVHTRKKNYFSECDAPKFVEDLFSWAVWTLIYIYIYNFIRSKKPQHNTN